MSESRARLRLPWMNRVCSSQVDVLIPGESSSTGRLSKHKEKKKKLLSSAKSYNQAFVSCFCKESRTLNTPGIVLHRSAERTSMIVQRRTEAISRLFTIHHPFWTARDRIKIYLKRFLNRFLVSTLRWDMSQWEPRKAQPTVQIVFINFSFLHFSVSVIMKWGSLTFAGELITIHCRNFSAWLFWYPAPGFANFFFPLNNTAVSVRVWTPANWTFGESHREKSRENLLFTHSRYFKMSASRVWLASCESKDPDSSERSTEIIVFLWSLLSEQLVCAQEIRLRNAHRSPPNCKFRIVRRSCRQTRKGKKRESSAAFWPFDCLSC